MNKTATEDFMETVQFFRDTISELSSRASAFTSVIAQSGSTDLYVKSLSMVRALTDLQISFIDIHNYILDMPDEESQNDN